MRTLSLPDKIDPWRLAAECERLEGTLTLAVLPRLAAASSGTDGVVTVALVAGIDRQGVRFIKGALQTRVDLICQRCLGTLRWPLNVTVRLGLVRDEAEADRLPEEYEPLLVAESHVCVADLVEDELLLALPQIPRHDDVGECAANGYRTPDTPDTPDAQPFALLASLLRDSRRSH